MRRLFEGADAWRNGFSVDAADLLQIQRTFVPWSDEQFKCVLVRCATLSGGLQTNTRTVERVLSELGHADQPAPAWWTD